MLRGTTMKGKTEDITTLVELFRSSGWDEMHVEVDGVQLFLSTDPNARLDDGSMPRSAPAMRAAPVVAAPAAAVSAVASAPVAAGATAQEAPAHWIAVSAPNLGTFYRSPKPGAPPFVEVGMRVEAATDVCLLEVMKLFTTVKAGLSGTIRRVCANDADMVEHGQTLFYIDPS
jgi:acetyl-CoA carboxylase biotin carboxyl carrier protein